jgi:hypothetical protein
MASKVWSTFNAPPRRGVILELVAVVDKTLAHPPTSLVVELAIDAVVVYKMKRADAIEIAYKRSILDTVQRTCTVTPESENGIEDRRFSDLSCITRFIPIAISLSASP